MNNRTTVAGLQIAQELYDFTQQHALAAVDLPVETFFQRVADVIQEFSPRNTELLAQRDSHQKTIDQWYSEHAGKPLDASEYKEFLSSIGYLEPEVDDFTITTSQVDPEITSTAGPQLVVPILNARFAINAANARWGSLYDALYGTDAISDADGAEILSTGYNPVRGAKVIAYAKKFLDEAFPLENGSHSDVTRYDISTGALVAHFKDASCALREPGSLRGYQGSWESPEAILLQHHGLHIEIQIDKEHPVGKTDPAGVKDLLVESAITTIMDFEDSVAAVDAEDKVLGYTNWLGLNRGDLTEEVTKGGKTFRRKLNPDRTYSSLDGSSFTLPGRSLLFVRNVGHLMKTDAILDSDGNPVYEGILDAIFTTLCGIPGLESHGLQNSRTQSIYIVKPKMHGSAEVAFAVDLFAAVEKILSLPEKTIKIGIMDEERRTTVNLKNAIKAAQDRVVFINTGFLDRTGDEIHTSLLAGPFVRKEKMKSQPWLNAYEKSNVSVGLAAGLSHKAQIGKGMWAMPDLMADLLVNKIGQPQAGATTAWVPSPTAATLHALHYHAVDVFAVHKELSSQKFAGLDDILTVPLAGETQWSPEEIQEELDNNCQSILGYVVRWIDQGVGCSKVPDIRGIGLMEDRATLRISSQLLANWLHHKIIDEQKVVDSLKRMALVVDKQNAHDHQYRPLADNDYSSIAFQTAQDLILLGARQPNGYTEPILHQRRKEVKASQTV